MIFDRDRRKQVKPQVTNALHYTKPSTDYSTPAVTAASNDVLRNPTPQTLTPQVVERLQGQIGNRAVQHLIQRVRTAQVVQRLKVNNAQVNIDNLTTRDAKEYADYATNKTPTPPNVIIEVGDETALLKALGIMGRLTALERQIAQHTAKLLLEDKTQSPSLVPNPLPNQIGATIPTKPLQSSTHTSAGPYNLWSGTKSSASPPLNSYGKNEKNTGEYQAETNQGFIMGQTQHHFNAEAMLFAAEGMAHGYEQDPEYHKTFMTWLEEPLTDTDLANAGLTAKRADFENPASTTIPKALKPWSRAAMLRDPLGEQYVTDKLKNLKATAGPLPADKSPAIEQAVTAQNTSDVKNASKLSGLTGNETALIGLHDANFHSAWDPTSELTGLDAVRSFTPVASYGVPGHYNPTNTVQFKVEIPTIKKEAAAQKVEITELIGLLNDFNTAIKDTSIVNAIDMLRTGIDFYVDGTNLLTIDTSLSKNTWPPQQDRLDEDKKRKGSVRAMELGRQNILSAIQLLKKVAGYRKNFA